MSRISPYQILGVNETDSLEIITKKYKDLLKILHPDKSNTLNYKNLNLSIEQRIEAFKNVKNAFSEILKTKKETEYPDYNIDYLEHIEHKQTKINHENFNINNFNNNFLEEKNIHEINGIADPYSRGYDMFSPKITNLSGPVKIEPRSDINVSTPTQLNSNKIINYLPKEAQHFVKETIGFQELGITKIDDFSMSTGNCKEKLCGSDLMSVYGQNNEYWEDTVLKNKSLYEKFNNNSNLTNKMNSIQESRSNIYKEPIDIEIQQKIDEDKNTLELFEKIRLSNLNQIENYYQKYNDRISN